MVSLAASSDVEAVLVRSLSTEETAAVDRLLELASGRFRRATRQVISAVAADVVTLEGTMKRQLLLPEQPVTAVASVTIDGFVIPSSEYNLRTWGLERPWGAWGTPLSVLVVTYDHGYATIPDEIVGVVAEWVAAALTNPSNAKSINLDGYSVAWDVGITEEQHDIIDDYRCEAPTVSLAMGSPW